MTKAEKRALVIALIDKWRVPLFLGGWTINIRFPARIKEVASCASQPEYMTCDTFWNLNRMPDSQGDIEELVAHELCHAHVEALANLAERGARRSAERREAIRMAEEYLTTTISRALLPYLRSL